MNIIFTLPLNYLMSVFYPKLYALHSLTDKVSHHHIITDDGWVDIRLVQKVIEFCYMWFVHFLFIGFDR